MLDGQWHSFARNLAIHAPPLAPDTLCHAAFAVLTDNPHWPGLAVVDGNAAIVGLLSRRACLTILAKPLMLDLYAKRPVERIMVADPLSIDEGDSLDEIGARIAQQRPDALVDGFIITHQGHYVGVASPLDLLAKTTEQARHRAEVIERAGAAAEAANAAKSTFLANLSHEIRTPLNGVLANLELLAHTRIDSEQAGLVNAASVAAQALFEIIGDVLDLSKIEAGKLAVESIPMEPVALVRDIAVLMGGQARQLGLALGCHVEPSAALEVLGDPTRLRQVVMNITGNAMKFTRQGGIFLHVSRADDGNDEHMAELEFEICDTGIGFAAEKSASLFDAFVQEDASTTRRFGGTGLGLAICKALVELMGGHIDGEGQANGGATFWFRIPFPLAGPAPPPPTADISDLSVLLVGGQSPWRARLDGMLETAGVRVTTAGHAEDAVGLLRQAASTGHPFDAALVPVSDDDDAALALPYRCRELTTRLLMLSERDDRAARRAGYAAGYRHGVALPARPADLVWGLGVACARVAPLESATPPVDDIAALIARLKTRKGARILVVDDNSMNRQVATQQLAKLGFACDLAEHGRAALSLATSDGYDLILCDCQMPEMDGYDFTRAYRHWEQNHGRGRTPVIALTAHALQGDAEKCARAGMDGYLSKPVKIARMAETLRTWLPDATAPQLPPSPARGPAMPAPDLDLDLLTQIIADDSPAAMVELLDLFIHHFRPVHAQLEAAITARNHDRLADASHAGKGMACNAAAMALGEAFATLEDQARQQADWAAIVEQACRLPALLAALCTQRDRLAQGPDCAPDTSAQAGLA